jgi:predicted metalloprotease
LRLGGKTGGLGLLVVVAVVVLSGGDFGQILGVLLGGGGSTAAPQVGSQTVPRSPANTEATEFVSVILRDTETTWHELFAQSGAQYREPRLVLFSNAVDSACGYATAASGPFYCPGDTKVYLDTSFFSELARMGGRGDFAQAYVIAHEIGHHVQNLSNTLPRVARLQQGASREQANALQVLVELQADCLAGVWANHAATQRDLLEAGDVEEGLQAAASIGDDRLQRNAGRRVQPESFTHGSSAQRVEWFRRGMQSGDIGACDTFSSAGVRI